MGVHEVCSLFDACVLQITFLWPLQSAPELE
jgi:hypothetical protein